jgi:hypothetical protein
VIDRYRELENASAALDSLGDRNLPDLRTLQELYGRMAEIYHSLQPNQPTDVPRRGKLHGNNLA